MNKDVMIAIEEKAKGKAKRLAKQARTDIEKELDNMIYHQMKKLEHKAKFLREFWASFELDKKDMQLVREELLAERVALSVMRSGETKGTNAEKILAENEFSSMTSTMRSLL